MINNILTNVIGNLGVNPTEFIGLFAIFISIMIFSIIINRRKE